jgi:hypothetical protein
LGHIDVLMDDMDVPILMDCVDALMSYSRFSFADINPAQIPLNPILNPT